MRWWLKMVMTLIALLWLCSMAEALTLSHDSGWRYSSDRTKEAGVCKHREEEWGWPAIWQRVEKFAVLRKKTLKWLAKVGFLSMERIWRLIGKSILDSRWTAIVIFLQHGVTASVKHSSVELEICSKLQNAKSLGLYKNLTSPIFICSSNLRKVAHWVAPQSRNHTSYFIFCFAV